MPAFEANQDLSWCFTHAGSRSGDVADMPSRSSSPLPISSGRSSPTMVFNPYYTGRPKTPSGAGRGNALDRQEIIRRIKSRDDRSRPSSPEVGRQTGGHARSSTPLSHDASRTSREESGNVDPVAPQQELGLQIERPRSALHKGDFRNKDQDSSFEVFGRQDTSEQQSVLSTSPPAPWHPGFPAAAFRQAWNERRPPSTHQTATPRPPRTRAVSHNLFQFAYKPPTSPLVNQSRPDTPPLRPARQTPSPDKQSRRHTFSPQALLNITSSFAHAVPSIRTEQAYPYQAHQPRRSLHSLNAFSSSPTSPSRQHALTSRRPSVSSEAHSPLHHAPMVGSYEESILRGRMSTAPSKPLDFIAQIGVLGRGDCKPSLRCPPHVAVPFPAVFYSYGASGRPNTLDQPSPYVGLVDLENGLPSLAKSDKRRQRLGDRLQSAVNMDDATQSDVQSHDELIAETSRLQRIRKRQKAKRRSASPKVPSGGCYRIPQQGQVQIVIKNPNKTAVKLFLIPYDLSDMAPGQKTFIRQRSYSAGPIIDMPLTSRKNLGTDRPEASLSSSEDPNDRPVLRYLVHLHICCTGRGRFWLYKSIRVVFANRVPDGKEKLRNEIQLPEPRYSTYKPTRDSTAPHSQQNSPASHPLRDQHDIEMMSMLASRNLTGAASLPSHDYADRSYGGRIPSFNLPFQASLLPTVESRPSSRHDSDMMDVDSNKTRSELGDPLSPTSPTNRPMSPLSPLRCLEEPFSFERDRSRERQGGASRGTGESLLSQRLRGLGM